MIRVIEGRDWRDSRRNGNAWILGRLKPGLSREEAEASLAVQAGLLYAKPEDAMSLAAVALMMIVSAVGAWAPARRAVRVDPLTALRYE